MILEALEFFENPIMFIDEIHMILGAGGKTDSGTSMSNILKPALARGNIRCIGATTTEEYRSTFEKDTALARRFQKLEIFEPSVSDTIKILTGSIEKYEEFHNVKYDPAAIEEAVVLTNRYIVDRRLPDKAFDMIDQAGARKKNSGVLIDMEKNIKESVVGQDEAVEQVCNAIMISRAGLKDENKPAGAFLFNGSTGTGKTFLAKKMAECLSIPLVRFDMSEYMEKHSVSKLIGAAPGYVGYGDGSAGDGLLINAIESNPHSIILIDEVEKAHPQVLNIFLQVMDEGHLTSSSGKKVKFTNATIVFTSNAGASTRAKSSNGFVNIGSSEVKAIEEMKKFFAPEFFNRLDAVVNFNALTIDNVKRIVVSMIENVAKLVDDKGITLSISDEASEYLATTGFDAQMGARPLSRKIDQCVKLPLSKMIIIDNIESGSHIEVVMESGELKLVHTEPKQKEEEAEIVSEQV
jgi:ATP-dependent Clp protease ATP-binding subunit ClpA